MIESLKGLSVNEALKKKDALLNVITKDDIPVDTSLGKLKVFEGVKRFPVRVKCAALTWRALENALQDEDKETKISTE